MAIEPLYSLDVACELIPIARTNINNILIKYKDRFDPPRYNALSHGQARMLTETECLKIRELVIQTGTVRSPLRTRQAHSLTNRKIVDLLLA